MKKIELTRGKSATIDDADFAMVRRNKWYFSNGYAVRDVKFDGKKTQIRMHRLIANTPEGMDTDHINGNKLDNRRANLRVCKHYQNGLNREKQANNNSGYKGVSWSKPAKMWQVQIQANKVRHHLGYFKNKVEAAVAFNHAAKELHGEYAVLNIV